MQNAIIIITKDRQAKQRARQ